MRTNLTGAKSPQEYCHHLSDCVAALKVVPQIKTCIDVGSGSGLPGIPWAILKPDTSFILVESNKKKSGFLLRCKSVLDLKNVEVCSERFENLITPPGFHTPIIVSRGTAAPKKLLKLILGSKVPFNQWLVFSTPSLHQEFLTEGENSDMEITPISYERNLEGKKEVGMLTKIKKLNLGQ